MAIDFTMLRQGGILDPLAHAIEQTGADYAKRREQQRADAEAQLQHDRDYQLRSQDVANRTAREARQERGENAKMEVENSGRRSAVDAKIRAAIAAGDMAGARQLAADYAEVNPSDQTVQHGRPFEIKEPEAPGEAPAPPELHNELDESGEERPGAAEENLGAQDEMPQREAEYQSRVDAAAKGPTVKLGDVDTSVDEIRNAARRQSATDFSKVGDALQAELRQALESGDPLLREQANRRAERYSQLKAAVEAGTLKPFDAMKQLTSSQALDDKYRENARHDNTVGEFGLKKQQIANRKPTAENSRTAGTGGIDRKDLAAVESSINNFQKQWNLSSDRAEDTRLRGLLKNKDVSVVQRSLSDVLSRTLAGQKGVLTDSDINRLQGHMGGTLGDLQNYVSKMSTGDLDPQVFAKLMQGVEVVLQNHDTNRASAKAAWDKDYGEGSPWGSLKVGDHLKRKRAEYFGDDTPGGSGPAGETKEQRMARLKKVLRR